LENLEISTVSDSFQGGNVSDLTKSCKLSGKTLLGKPFIVNSVCGGNCSVIVRSRSCMTACIFVLVSKGVV